jgi:Golgi phosphoprotein 3 (GPP34)
MLMAERLLLLAQTIKGERILAAQTDDDLARGLSLSLLVELACLGRIQFVAKQISALDHLPMAHSLLTDALAMVAKSPNNPKTITEQVRRSFNTMVGDLRESLTRRGILLRLSHRRFGLFPVHRYAVQSTRTHQECIDHLLHSAAQMDERSPLELGFYLCADGLGLAEHWLGREDQAAAHVRLLKLSGALRASGDAVTADVARARCVLALANPFATGMS